MKLFLLPVAVCLPFCASLANAQTPWSENFDSYAPNSSLTSPAQGGWEEWSLGAGALTSTVQARSPANSVDIVGATDLVHQYTGFTSGKWVYRAWQYIPSTMVGTTYFILLNTYAYPSGPYNWSVQVAFSISTGVQGDIGTTVRNHPYVPLVTNAWVPIMVIIDLDQDWVQFYYNGTLLDDPVLADHPALGGGYRWSFGVFGQGGGVFNIAAVDLYANSASPVYYDDLSLRPFAFEDFGQGCPGSMGQSAITAVIQPTLTSGVGVFQADNLAIGAGFFALGFSNQMSLAGPLPLNLGPLGAPNCWLNVSPDVLTFVSGTGNVAVTSLTIPNQPGYLGMRFLLQAASLDPLVNALWIATSKGYLVSIGQ